MNPELPSVAEGLDLLRLPSKRSIGGLSRSSFRDSRLEVRVEADPIRWVDIDHLDLAAEPLLLEQAGHDDQRVPEDEPVHPAHLVLVELDGP